MKSTFVTTPNVLAFVVQAAEAQRNVDRKERRRGAARDRNLGRGPTFVSILPATVADPTSKSPNVLLSVLSTTHLFFKMVADAVIYHPTVAHYLRFVATTGESQTDELSTVQAQSSAQC